MLPVATSIMNLLPFIGEHSIDPYLIFFKIVPFYRTKLGPLSHRKEMIKEGIFSWFDSLGYVEEFGPNEVPASEMRKRRMDTSTCVSAVIQDERKEILGDDKVLEYFLYMGLYFTNIMNTLSSYMTLTLLKVL